MTHQPGSGFPSREGPTIKPDGRNLPIDLSDHVILPHPKYKMTITTDPEKLKFLYSAIGRVFSQPRALGLLSAPPTVEEAEDLLLSPVDDLVPVQVAL